MIKSVFQIHRKCVRRWCHNTARRPYILGIESSCDDCGAAIVSSDGKILGECVMSQQNCHLRFGGIIPPVAQDSHRNHIENVVKQTFTQAERTCEGIDAIAVTNRPGLPLSLLVGVRYAKYLARKFDKPIIPVHHMEAHALMARMTNSVPFPYLCILLSGGHAIITLVKSTNDFYILGETVDDAPGEMFDKIARRLKLRNIPQYAWLSGGQAIEQASSKCHNPASYDFPAPLSQYRDCQFSFAGLKNSATRQIILQERVLDLPPDVVIPDYEDFCAGLMNATVRHIAHRTKRAIRFCEGEAFWPTGTKRCLVISGGVASNNVIFNAISNLAAAYNFETIRPKPAHCTDNGIMIAWNGIEKYITGQNITKVYNDIDIFGRANFGTNLIQKVKDANIASQ
ncbi:probable tRNA N6-adenosine threonylcarbamoyltransferase, mitochondrial [Malaya genurostris]|uniref:probable tRNA N6-adenosine threonylcarbamoyltransferase, mitochondrial n=1 Tax=Malaya genurostris TaxID=325434 RepID=UPI0026F38324|nr:probable tRNA N6-adenosine threonylcarbamoyltransferase, mitochondrial [Malaya genurostris]